MQPDLTLWALVTEEHIAIEDLGDAIDAYLADPTTGEHRNDTHYILDLAASIARYATRR